MVGTSGRLGHVCLEGGRSMMTRVTIEDMQRRWESIEEGDRVSEHGVYVGTVLCHKGSWYAVRSPQWTIVIYREGELQPFPPQSPPLGMPR